MINIDVDELIDIRTEQPRLLSVRCPKCQRKNHPFRAKSRLKKGWHGNFYWKT
jgi:hypothetical protein